MKIIDDKDFEVFIKGLHCLQTKHSVSKDMQNRARSLIYKYQPSEFFEEGTKHFFPTCNIQSEQEVCLKPIKADFTTEFEVDSSFCFSLCNDHYEKIISNPEFRKLAGEIHLVNYNID